MSFGFGVGDILAVSKLALGIWGRVRDSSDQFKSIRGETAGLKIVLDDLAEQVSNGQLSSKQIKDLSILVEGCRKVLEDLDAKLEKYDSLDTHASGLGAKTEKVWKKLKWNQSEIDALRLRIISNITGLEAFNAGIASRSSHVTNQKIEILDDHFKSLHLNIEHKDHQAIVNWLSSSNFPAQQASLSSGRQEGTGSWLIESEEYKTWTECGGKTLICQGIPGAGKTMLASLVIDDLKETHRAGNSGVSYIYCDYRMQQEQTLSTLVASLLKQVLQQQQVITTNVKEACQGHMWADTRPTFQEMLNMLQTAMGSFSRTYVIVDALDELSSQDRVRQNLLEELRNLQVAHGYNLLVTSRHITNLTLEFPKPLCLEIRASPEDVRRYVCGHMKQLPNCVRTNVGLQESIISSIVAAVDGMFLLAQLHLDSLKDQTSPKAIKRALMDLPKGFKALDKAYEGAMQRIDGQMEGFRLLAKEVLGWLTYAERLMSITELQHAIAIELGEKEFDKENLVDPSELVSVCAGLVVVDDQSNVVRLVHYTTQEYFEQHGESLLPGARQKIAESCLTYLTYDNHATGWLYRNHDHSDSRKDRIDCAGTFPIPPGLLSRMRPSVKDIRREYPFYNYAAQHWARHTGYGVHDRVKSLVLDFAKDDNKISTAAQVLLRLERNNSTITELVTQLDWDISRSTKPVSAMHLLAYLGAEELSSILLEQGFEADAKDLNNATPLCWAIYRGNLDVVKRLIARKVVDVNARNREGRTPLSWAAEMGHSAIVELLLTRKDVKADAKNLEHETPLFYAVFYSHEEIVRQLLMRDDFDINAVNKAGYTALHRAVNLKYADIVAILLARADIDVDHIDKKGQTPLIRAARLGYPEIVELLLSHGCLNANAKDFEGRTALLNAAIRGFEDVVKLLLTHHAIDLDIEDDKGRNVLTQVEDRQKRFVGYGKEEHQATLKLLRAAFEERLLRK